MLAQISRQVEELWPLAVGVAATLAVPHVLPIAVPSAWLCGCVVVCVCVCVCVCVVVCVNAWPKPRGGGAPKDKTMPHAPKA
jgi:hypothetical protein